MYSAEGCRSAPRSRVRFRIAAGGQDIIQELRWGKGFLSVSLTYQEAGTEVKRQHVQSCEKEVTGESSLASCRTCCRASHGGQEPSKMQRGVDRPWRVGISSMTAVSTTHKTRGESQTPARRA